MIFPSVDKYFNIIKHDDNKFRVKPLNFKVLNLFLINNINNGINVNIHLTNNYWDIIERCDSNDTIISHSFIEHYNLENIRVKKSKLIEVKGGLFRCHYVDKLYTPKFDSRYFDISISFTN